MSRKPAKSPQEIKKIRSNPINFILRPVGVLWDIVKYIIISVLIGITIEWVGMLTGFWPDSHAQDVLRQEMQYLGNNFSMTLFGMSAENTAFIIINKLNSYTIKHDKALQTDAIMIVIGWVHSLGNYTVSYINSAIYIIMIIMIRCVIITLSIALLLIVGIAATVDGLHERELRKLGGDDEHGDVYHWAKAGVPKIIVISPILYLAWPSAINPNFILLPGMLLFFMAVFLMFSKYKKVL